MTLVQQKANERDVGWEDVPVTLLRNATAYPTSARTRSARRMGPKEARLATTVWSLLREAYKKDDKTAYASPNGNIRRLWSAPSAGACYPARLGARLEFESGFNSVFELNSMTEELEFKGITFPGFEYGSLSRLSIEVRCDAAKSIEKYGPRGTLYALTDLGHVVHNLYAVLKNLGLKPRLSFRELGGAMCSSLFVEETSVLSIVVEQSATADLATEIIDRWRQRQSNDVLDSEVFWRHRNELLPSRRSVAEFSGKSIGADSLLEAIAASGQNIPIELCDDATRWEIVDIFHQRNLGAGASVDSEISAICLGQEVAKNASGVVAIVVDSLDMSGKSSSFLTRQFVMQQVLTGFLSQALSLEFLDRGIASTPIGAFDGGRVEKLLKLPQSNQRVAMLMLFGSGQALPIGAKADRR